MGDEYLIQDSRGLVGNCVLWWGPNRCGYTSRVEEAGIYSREEAYAQRKSRKTDIPWPRDVVMKAAKLTVDRQFLPRKPPRRRKKAVPS